MIGVDEEDRDALRFLWVDNIHAEDAQVHHLRFTRVVFGVCSSPFLLNSTLRHHLEKFRGSHPELVKKLIDSLYVDDIITGAPTEEQALQLHSESREVLKEGAFNLRKFRTNSTSLQLVLNVSPESVPPENDSFNFNETYADATLGKLHSNKTSTVKVLGVVWDPGEDCLEFGVADIAKHAASAKPTKRNVVSIIGRFYDPLGILAPVIIQFKKLFQKLKQVQWDEILPDALEQEWRSLIGDLHNCQHLSIPRSYHLGNGESVPSHTLCGFCDASTTAYAAVIYLAVKTPQDTHTQFLASKTRVAPIQAITIPRLELLSALLLSRLITTSCVNSTGNNFSRP